MIEEKTVFITKDGKLHDSMEKARNWEDKQDFIAELRRLWGEEVYYAVYYAEDLAEEIWKNWTVTRKR